MRFRSDVTSEWGNNALFITVHFISYEEIMSFEKTVFALLLCTPVAYFAQDNFLFKSPCHTAMV